jgi:O-antigen ligase
MTKINSLVLKIVPQTLMVLFCLGLLLVWSYPALRHMNRAVGIGLAFLYIISFLKFKQILATEILLYGVYLLWCAISGFFVAANFDLYSSMLITLGQLWALMIASSGFSTLWKTPATVFFAIFSVAILLVLFAIFTGDFFDLSFDSVRYSSLVRNPNDLGYYSFLGVVSLTWFWGHYKSNHHMKIFFVIVSMAFIFMVIASGSRKAYLGLLAYILLWVVFCYRKKIFQNVGTALFVLLVAAASLYLYEYVLDFTYLGVRLERAGENPYFLDYTRTTFYEEAWGLFLRYPITGVGLANFRVYSVFGTYSHSDYMEVLSTSGFIGFILYFSIYAIIAKRMWGLRNIKSEKIKYYFGVYSALILVLLMLATGRINSQSILTMFIIAGIAGHLSIIEIGQINKNIRARKLSDD